MKEIGVSVLCVAYNQEKYIRQTLESFVMQKTNFPFEVLINDDASTDKTPEIIKEFADKYPNIIKPIYQKENQYSKGVSIHNDFLFPIAAGKYLAFCEGDDFWTDENKLQLQYDIMEKNPDCHLCLHKVRVVSENGNELKETYPKHLRKKVITTKKFLKLIFYTYTFQTSCYFVRKEDYKNFTRNFNESLLLYRLYLELRIGDEPTLLYFGLLGNTYYINKVMSKYRKNSLGSWTSRMNSKPNEQKVQIFKYLIKITEEIDKYTSYKYHKLCVVRFLRFSIEIAKYTLSKKDLLLKNRKEFFGRFNLFHKSILFIYILFPLFGNFIYNIYLSLYKKF
ncbi:MAG: glycosyltransferase [Elusimicrobia bacterium]|nr:glycosyltransferase [Elusimicrobiota bacterium]